MTNIPDWLIESCDEETAEEIRRIFSPMPDEILRQAQEDFDTAEDLPLSPDEVAYAERLVRALGGELFDEIHVAESRPTREEIPQFALAADDRDAVGLMPSGERVAATNEPIIVDGDPREFLTDRFFRVFVPRHESENYTHLIFDERLVPLKIESDGKTALLVGFGLGKLLAFIERTKQEPGHSIRWVASLEEGKA